MFTQRILQFKLLRSDVFNSKARMSAQSKKDFEAIMSYNKLLKKPVVSDETYTDSEIKQAKFYFDKVNEYRKRSEEGFKPAKLFMVWRVMPTLGTTMYEKEILVKLGLVDKRIYYAIVKNTASNNKVLWDIKHLIRVKPITFPDGFPSEDDLGNVFLKQNGELIVDSRLRVDPEELESEPEYKHKTLDHKTIKESLRKTWNVGYPKMY